LGYPRVRVGPRLLLDGRLQSSLGGGDELPVAGCGATALWQQAFIPNFDELLKVPFFRRTD
jgi:hypothetical protein